MHRLVRDLYRRVLWVGREYPTGLTHVRLKAKEHFRANALVSSDEEINRCIARGRWFVNEMIGVIQLKKYRAMRQRYGTASETSLTDALDKVEREATKISSPPPTDR